MHKVAVDKVVFDKFTFDKVNIPNKKESLAEFNLKLSKEKDNEGFSQIIGQLKMDFIASNEYYVSSEITGFYKVDLSEYPNFKENKELTDALLFPILNKFKIYVALFSEGVDGVISTPDINLELSN